MTLQCIIEDDKNPTGYPQVFDELTNGAVTRTYTYGLQRIDEDQVMDGAWTPSFYGYDGGGNVRQLTNSAGAVTDSYEYDAFGSSFTVSGSTPNNYLYRGEQWDPDLGLYYLRARYYNPTTGRFMSRDPLDGSEFNPKSLNKYLYADADPVNGRDLRGHEDLVEYAVKTVEIYNDYVAPALSGNDFAKCTSTALDEEAEDLNAVLEGSPSPISGDAIAKALGTCAGQAVANIIKGPWGFLF